MHCFPMIRKFLFPIFLIASLIYCQASTDLIVSNIDGSSRTISLDERPKITISGNSMQIMTERLTLEIDIQQVKDFKFSDTSDVKDVESSSMISFEGNNLSIFADRDGFIARIFTLNGLIIQSKFIKKGTKESIDLGNLDSGIYIVNTPNQTFKFHKK